MASFKHEEHQYNVVHEENTDWNKEKYKEANKNIEGHVTVIPLNKKGTSTTSTPLWRWLRLIVIGIGILATLTSTQGLSEPRKLTKRATPNGALMEARHVMSCNLNDASLRPSESNRDYLKPSDVCWLSENQLVALTEHYLVFVNINRTTNACEYTRSHHIRWVVATRLACASNGYTYAKVDSWHNRGIRVSTNLTYGFGWFPLELASYIKQYTVSTDSILIESGNNLYMYDLDRKFKEKKAIQVQGPPSYGPAYLSSGGWLWRTTTVINSTGVWLYNTNTQNALVINGTYTYGVTGVGQYVLLPDYYNNSILVYSQWGSFVRNLQMNTVVQSPVNIAAIGDKLAVIPDGTWNIEILDLIFSL